MNINRVTISGRLTKDPVLRQTSKGAQVLCLSVAINDRVLNKQTGEWEDRANFVDCMYFAKSGERLAEILAKGSYVIIDGKLRWSSWEHDGQKRSKIEVVASSLELPPVQRTEEPDYGLADEDIPF